MSKLLSKPTLAAGALAATLLAAGAAAITHAHGNSEPVTPVTYTVKEAPQVTPEEAQRAVASAKDLSTAFRVASEKVLSSVVTIENRPRPLRAGDNSRQAPQVSPFGETNPFEGTPFEDFFKDHGITPGIPMRPQPRAIGAGSGVIIDSSGIILTNNHVVEGNGDVTVKLNDGREFEASSVWTDARTDVAVVKIDASELPAAKLGDSDTVAVGDWVLALGQPFGLQDTVTAGIISAKQRGIGITDRESFLQTDAAINPGNSGGPLVNLDGEVIGINTAISSRSGGNEGIGFAIPINLAQWVGEQLAHGGVVRRAYLGVGIQPLTAALAEQFNLKPREGVAVTEVLAGSPAATAGLRTGDVIVEYAGVAVSSPSELQLLVERSEPEKTHVLTVVRDGQKMDLNFKPEEQPESYGTRNRSAPGSYSKSQSSQFEKPGLEVSSLDDSIAEQLGLQGVAGVVITSVRPGSPAEQAGLASGMVITQVNRSPVKNVDEFMAAMKKAESDSSVLLLVRSETGSRFIVLK